MDKQYEFDTEDGRKTLAQLFDGRSQLLAYNIMYGPDYTLGACPGCTALADALEVTRVHLSHQDVTLVCCSRAPLDRLLAYKQRTGWTFHTFPRARATSRSISGSRSRPSRSSRSSRSPRSETW